MGTCILHKTIAEVVVDESTQGFVESKKKIDLQIHI
jgi:hypothetical protein